MYAVMLFNSSLSNTYSIIIC